MILPIITHLKINQKRENNENYRLHNKISCHLMVGQKALIKGKIKKLDYNYEDIPLQEQKGMPQPLEEYVQHIHITNNYSYPAI